MVPPWRAKIEQGEEQRTIILGRNNMKPVVDRLNYE